VASSFMRLLPELDAVGLVVAGLILQARPGIPWGPRASIVVRAAEYKASASFEKIAPSLRVQISI
jgi:hypothetical protein